MGRNIELKASRRELRRVVGQNLIEDVTNLVNNQNILHRDHLLIQAVFTRGFFARMKWLFFGV